MRQLPGSDAIFLSLETSTTHAHIGGVFVLEPVTDDFGFEKFKRHCAERLSLTPQFTSKLREVPLGIDRPYVIEDPDFDVSNHLHRIAVPSPGSLRDLATLVADLYAHKLDRRLPLWEMWWIEGLEGGRVAVLTKTHHCLIDGVSGIGLAELICDIQPDPPPRARRPAKPKRREREPTDLELYLGGLWNSFGTPLRVARYVTQAAMRGLAMIPYAKNSSIGASVPKVSFNADIGPRRSVAWTTISLSDVRAMKKHHDVKVNDVVLELCSSAVRRYLEAQGELPDEELVVSVPVSTRDTDDKAPGNQLASMMVGWATDVADPVERLLKISENTAHAKEMTAALRAREIQAMGDTVAPAVLNLAYRTIASTAASMTAPANAVVSNVPGAPVPLYLAGARIEATYPVSLIMPGMGLNITVLSYMDRIDFGFTVDPDLVPDPWYLADGIPLAMEELKEASGIDRAVPLRNDVPEETA
ncbi:MAG: wax ester/triacylglycerol synthase family O-acyltransferase [Myxococcota bacterium]